VRDDLPDTNEYQVYNGRLTLGLFGTVAPNHVSEFMKYVNVVYNPADDNPLPSYGRSTFTRLDQGTGLLEGGLIPGLEITSIGGGSAIRYGGRILPSTLWIEKGGGTDKPVSHSMGRGLLTHKTLDPTPKFGITTRAAPLELDSTNVVFGRVLPDDNMLEFLRRVEDIKTYSMDRPAPSVDASLDNRVQEELAAKVFSTQKEFFRGAAKTFGDTRLDNVYEGKFLRRVEVTRVGVL